MKNWVRALLDPTDIVQSPSSAKKQITPPPKFELPMDESTQRRSRRSVSPSKKSTTSPRKSRQPRTTKDAPSTPSTTAANENLQKALEVTASTVDSDLANGGVIESVEQVEVVESAASPQKAAASPEKKSRKSKKDKAEDGKKDEKEEKEEKKTEKKKKKEAKEKEAEKEDEKEAEKEVEKKADEASKTTISLDVPLTLLPAGPSAADTEDMLAKAKEIVEEALTVDGPASDSAAKANKRRAEDDDEETSAEASQRAKKAKVLEEKLKRERVRNRALFGVSAAFALA